MNKRLIDANVLKRHMISAMNLAKVETVTREDIEYAIDHSDTIDAVEVVRCGKCKYYDPESEYCWFWHGVRHPVHYCGEGDF